MTDAYFGGLLLHSPCPLARGERFRNLPNVHNSVVRGQHNKTVRMNKQQNTQTIAPFLADNFIDLEESIFDLNKYARFLNQDSDRLGTFKKYLICKLHDSRVIDIKQDNDKLEILLNDFSTYVFADTLIEKYKLLIDSDNISFPLTIEFIGDLVVEYNSVSENGNLQSIAPIDLDNYLYEEVTKCDDERIEIAFLFWKSNLKEDRPGERIIIIVSAKNLTITESQDHAWTEIFGHEYDEIYEYFKHQFDSDRYVYDHYECEKLIDEIENKMKNKKPTA